jgi:hypothetical protein
LQPDKASKPSPSLTRKNIHFDDNVQMGVHDIQTAAEFPRKSRSRSKERLLDRNTTADVSSIMLDTVLDPDTQLLVSEAECRALPVDDRVPEDTTPVSSAQDITPVVLSGKMTISFLGGGHSELDGPSCDVPEVSIHCFTLLLTIFGEFWVPGEYSV